MARLIPSFMDDHTPPGERDVFNMLAGGPDDWVALHSLDLAPWNRGLRTEIDFVVIVPQSGILCIEVKSHQSISFTNDRWVPSTVKRSPFKQAADGRYAFARSLCKLAPRYEHVPVVHLCIFPNASFDLEPNMSVQPWELMDASRFRSFSSSRDFSADLEMRILQSIDADGRLQALRERLTPDSIESIVAHCLPVRRRQPGAREEIARREQEVERTLRVQQKPVLQLAALNDRLIVSGGAGTGKTLIAMEVARRSAESGHRVALLCFNQLVGEWLVREMGHISPPLPNLVVGRAIRILAEMTDTEIPASPSRRFWEDELPERIEERFTDPEFKSIGSVDYLVVDETQDLMARPRLWQCLTECLVGGIEGGAFALFGDFEHQVLSDRNAMEATLRSVSEAASPARWQLTENCRNYPIVGETALRLAGISGSVYSGYMRSGGAARNYEVYFYESDRQQLDALRRLLDEAKAAGYRPTEVSVLSACAPEKSAATRLLQEGIHLRPAWQSGGGTGYTSIHGFKGMENKVVILTDLAVEHEEFHRQLFYTGMTRATESIRVLCDAASRMKLSEWLLGEVSRG